MLLEQLGGDPEDPLDHSIRTGQLIDERQVFGPWNRAPASGSNDEDPPASGGADRSPRLVVAQVGHLTESRSPCSLQGNDGPRQRKELSIIELQHQLDQHRTSSLPGPVGARIYKY